LIAAFKRQGLSIRQIAKQLGRDPSTVSRELRRNAAPSHYHAPQAHKEATVRWSQSHQRPRLKTPQLRRYVRRKLRQGLSPELIAGRLRQQQMSPTVSHEAIYQWIYHQAPQYIQFLVRAHPKRRPGRYWKHSRLSIPCRTPVCERPLAAASRQEVGHWEADTVSWRVGVAGLMIAVERKTRFARLKRLPRKTAQKVSRNLISALRGYPRHVRRSLTYDNGPENSQHLQVNKSLRTVSYFCEPQQSWQKGTVENTVGLVRRYFPRDMDFSQVDDKEIRRVERILNDRPRKCLNYQTPREAFRAECCT